MRRQFSARAGLLVCRGIRNSRNIKNRKALVEALSQFGFAAIQPEKLKFDEQAMLFSSADVIVTEFGAAMANAVFCRPGTRVVEIIAEGQHDPWSAHLCAMLELDHVVLFQRQSEQELLDHPRHAKDFRIPVLGRCRECGSGGRSVSRPIGAKKCFRAPIRARAAPTRARATAARRRSADDRLRDFH